MDYNSEHFIRYINYEFWKENYEEIIKTGFDFPRIFISTIMQDYHHDTKRIKQLLDTYYIIPQKESEYYPLLKLMEFTEHYPEFRDLLKPCTLNYKNSVALIFSKTPRRWGLRGDPYFWTYLEERFVNAQVPFDDINLFGKIIRKTYIKLSGGKNIGEEGYIKEFAHGGMSSGMISDLWLDYIPLLKYRLIKLNNDYYLNRKEYSKIIENPKRIIGLTKWTLNGILERYDEPIRIWGM